MDRPELIIFQHLHWPDIRYDVQKEMSNFDTCERTNRLNKEYSKLPAKLADEIPWNKLCMDIIGPYIIR